MSTFHFFRSPSFPFFSPSLTILQKNILFLFIAFHFLYRYLSCSECLTLCSSYFSHFLFTCLFLHSFGSCTVLITTNLPFSSYLSPSISFSSSFFITIYSLTATRLIFPSCLPPTPRPSQVPRQGLGQREGPTVHFFPLFLWRVAAANFEDGNVSVA